MKTDLKLNQGPLENQEQQIDDTIIMILLERSRREGREKSLTKEMKDKLYITIGSEVNTSFVPVSEFAVVILQVKLKGMLLVYAGKFKAC